MSAEKVRIGARLRAERKARGWDMPEMIARLRAAAGERRSALPSHDSLSTYLKRWERGTVAVSERYRLLYSRAFDLDEGELFGADAVSGVTGSDGDSVDLIEMMRQSERTTVSDGTLDLLYIAVDRLCRDYPTVQAGELGVRTKRHLQYVLGLLDGPTTLHQHRELLVCAGWLAALLGCVDYDIGDKTGANTARMMAYQLGTQVGHGEILGWSWELSAWYALVEERYEDAVAAAQAGQRVAGDTSAGVQLVLQEARALARMGDADARKVLTAGGKMLQRLPVPDHAEHHFVFDRSKYDFYTATILTWLGKDDDAAKENASEVVVRAGTQWPMRAAYARMDLGIIAGRCGDIDEAVELGRSALEVERRSADLLPRAVELREQLLAQYSGEALIDDYSEIIREEKRKALH
jgi:transcriptional regulator with XRE-family HTH domain